MKFSIPGAEKKGRDIGGNSKVRAECSETKVGGILRDK